jgi:hypothetical protein
LFRFDKVVSNAEIEKSTIIINNITGKAIDIPESSKKKSEQLIQWGRNNRWNQRWRFVKESNGYLICS